MLDQSYEFYHQTINYLHYSGQETHFSFSKENDLGYLREHQRRKVQDAHVTILRIIYNLEYTLLLKLLIK